MRVQQIKLILFFLHELWVVQCSPQNHKVKRKKSCAEFEPQFYNSLFNVWDLLILAYDML